MINIFKKDYTLFLICLVILIISRLNTSLLNINVFNPDEYQLVANALKFKYYGINLNFFDGYSVGLYNAIILYLPNLIGFEITIFFVRLIGLILITFSLYFIYKTIALISTKTLSKIYIFLTIVFFSFTKDQDFLCFNGEILFCLVFSITLYLITNIWHRNNNYKNYQFYLIGILSSSIFFIKLQFIIYLGFLLLIFIVSYLKKKISLKNLIYFIVGLISHVLIVFIFFNVDLYNFFVNNFLRSLDYISQRNDLILLEKNISNDVSDIKKIKPFFYHLKFNLIFHYFYFLFFIFIFFSLMGKKNIFLKKNYELLIIYTGIFLSIIIAILIPGRMYRHYLYPLIFLTPVISAYGYNFLFNKISIQKFYYKILFGIVFLFLLTSVFFENKKYYALDDNKISKINISDINKNYKLFNFLLNSELKTAFIWGYMPQWYLMGSLSPVTSETTTEHQLKKNKLNRYFTNRTKKEIFANFPDIIIDGVRGKSFIYNNPIDSFENFLNKDGNEFLMNYFKITNQFKKDNCPIFYINKKFKKNIEKIINVKSISFQNKQENILLNNLLDLSVTNDTCNDEFEIEKIKNNVISIFFDKSEIIDSVLILNDKKSMHKKSIDTLNLKFFNDKEEKKIIDINLENYPFWNKIFFEDKFQADRVDIIINNQFDTSIGLNEIIFLRK